MTETGLSDLEFLERTKKVYESLAENSRLCFNVPFEDMNLGLIEVERRLNFAENRHLVIRHVLRTIGLSADGRSYMLEALGATEQEIQEAK